MNDNFMIEQLPVRWITTTLDAIAEGENAIVDGPFGSNLKVSDYIDDPVNGVPVLSTKNLEGDYSDNSVRFISKEKFESISRSQVKPGDILVAKIGSIGKIGIYPKGARVAIIPANLLKFSVSNSVQFQYVYYYLNSNGFQKRIKGIATATAQPAFNVTKFRILPIPIPPLSEQHRIVAKLEKFLSELDDGVESLRTVQQQLKIYRQAVLKWAFEGKLTEEWRKQQKGLPTAEALLEQIRKESEVTKQAGGKKIKKCNNTDIVNSLPQGCDLPEEWGWVRLGNVSEARLGKMLDKIKNKGTFEPYLRNINVRWGSFDLSDLLTMRFEQNESQRYGIQKGDLIICEGGEPGRAAIWNEQLPNMKIQKALHRVRFTNYVFNKYFYYYLCFSAKSKLLDEYFTGTTIKHLTGERLINMEFPICSLPEQHSIVQQIESRLSVADKLEETIEQSLKQAEGLRQSILKKAFDGRLLSEQELAEVRSDPEWEPANVLLERIKAQKANSEPKKNGKRGKKQT